MERFNAFLDKTFKTVLLIITIYGCIMLVVSWVYVAARYVFNNSLTWGEEFLKISLAWFGLLSASVISYDREHIGVVIFREKLFPPKAQIVCKFICQVVITIVPIGLIAAGLYLLSRTAGQTTPAMRLPIGIQYASIPVCFLIMLLYDIRNLIVDIKALRSGGEVGQNPSKHKAEVDHNGGLIEE